MNQSKAVDSAVNKARRGGGNLTFFYIIARFMQSLPSFHKIYRTYFFPSKVNKNDQLPS